MVDNIWCGTVVSEVIPCADFMFNVSIESGAGYIYIYCLLLCVIVVSKSFMAASMVV